ncbi:MAG: NADP-dependent isocitrate dehydrogenase [Alphaproteobacteria bacterium]
MSTKTPITVAHGDGIGPEIMPVALRVLEAGGALFDVETITIGEKVYLSGVKTGIVDSAWESLRRTKVFYKAPITTPIGEGYQSLNVAVRKTMGLFANVRPCVAYHPFVGTKFPGMDVVIVRENEEDLYAGIEYQQTVDVMQCLKLISVQGSERIIRYAFEYARTQGRKKVTCLHKANIMKMTDGLFRTIFARIATEYPDIVNDQMIIDIGTARLAAAPHDFDVIVTLNLYGDIISDVAAEITGSVGLGASSNIGEHVAMFEAIHGSAPMIAGKDIANPSGLLLSGVMMLLHIGQNEAAARIHNAWLRTLEEGLHTGDVYKDGLSKKKLGTKEFADAVISRMGKLPETMAAIHYKSGGARINIPSAPMVAAVPQELTGVDVFIGWNGTPDSLAQKLAPIKAAGLELGMITNRGVKVWPNGMPETLCTQHYRCRYAGTVVSQRQILALLGQMADAGIDILKTETLRNFDGKRGYSG